jgi:uncharacterized protein (TIGR03067 family)
MKQIAFILLLLTGCATMNKESLTGTWKATSAVVNGKELSPKVVDSLRLTLTRDRYKTERADEVLFDSTYKTDTTKTPHQITMVGTEGDLTGKEAHGIYTLEADTLRICYALPGSPTPTNFASAPGSGAYLVVWKRELTR